MSIRSERAVEWNRNNPTKVRVYNTIATLKRRAAKEGVKFEISSEWLREKFDGLCDVTGLAFGEGVLAPTVVRKNPSADFSPENCQVVTQIVSKQTDLRELYVFCKLFSRIYENFHL